jgi:capsule polysaccharide export protein KpsE/RkpR
VFTQEQIDEQVEKWKQEQPVIWAKRQFKAARKAVKKARIEAKRKAKCAITE